MAYTAYDTDTSTGDNPSEFATTTKANIEAADLHHVGTGAPATGLANGRVWADSTAAALYILKLYQNAAWVSMMSHSATAHLCNSDLDLNGNEALNLLAQALATGSLSTTEARIQWDTTLNRLAYGDGTNTFYAAACRTDASTVMRIPCRMTVANLGSPATASTATDFGGWTLDAAAEELTLIPQATIPAGWTGADDLTLTVHCLLLAAETANDDIDMDGDWIRLASGGGEGPGLAAEGFAAVTHDIGSANAQYDYHAVDLTVDHDAVGNVIAAGDQMRFTINHNAAGQVAGLIVIGADLQVPVFNYAG